MPLLVQKHAHVKGQRSYHHIFKFQPNPPWAKKNSQTVTHPLLHVVGGSVVYIYEPRPDFQQCGILTSVDSDEPVQPPLKLRNSKWCSVSILTVIEYSRD